MSIRTAYDFIRLGRPHFLFGGFLFHGLGVMAALYQGATIDLRVLIWGQVAITAAQFMTHYANEYFDLDADKANETPTQWSGGSRVLAEGRLAPPVALITALSLAAIALAAAVVLILALGTGPLTALLVLLAGGLSWLYSGPPLYINRKGAGEFTVSLITPLLTPLLGFYLQSGRLTPFPFLVSLPLMCLQFTMVMSFNFPDEAGDKAAGKRTLVVHLGPEKAARLYVLAIGLAYAILPLLLLAGLPLAVTLAYLVPSPLAAWQVWRMRNGVWADPLKWNSLGFWSTALFLGTAAAGLSAFVLLTCCF